MNALKSTLQRPVAKMVSAQSLAVPSLSTLLSRGSYKEEISIRRTFATHKDAIGRFGRYLDDYEESLSDSTTYWHRAASELDWHTSPTLENTLQNHPKSDKMHQWFTDGMINTSYNCLDRHVKEGRANQKALIYDSPVTNTQRHYTYAELLDEVSLFAAGLSDLGVTKGDCVVIYMPMIPEAVIAMLACARIGAIHSVVFGGFASKGETIIWRQIHHLLSILLLTLLTP